MTSKNQKEYGILIGGIVVPEDKEIQIPPYTSFTKGPIKENEAIMTIQTGETSIIEANGKIVRKDAKTGKKFSRVQDAQREKRLKNILNLIEENTKIVVGKKSTSKDDSSEMSK